jgi:hypothetical protein
MDDVKTGGKSLIRDKLRGHLFYCLSGIRHKDGMICKEALSWNLGTCRLGAKGEN